MGAIHGTYYKTPDGRIFKYNVENDYFLLCTPWEKGEDRRKKHVDIPDAVKYNKHKAVQEINEIWRNTAFKWEHNGKKFETRGTMYDEKIITTEHWEFNGRKHSYNVTNYKGLFSLCPEHKFTYPYKFRGETKYGTDIYYLCMYQGKLVWVQKTQYIPQVYYYKFEGIDVLPKIRVGWTNINCLRPVFCITDKKYI